MTFPNARDCEHGRQRGKCPECDAAEEISELTAALEAPDSETRALREETKRMRHLIETQQAWIAELREALSSASHSLTCDASTSHYKPCSCGVMLALPRTDNLSTLAAHDAELINDEKRNPWKRAIIDAAVVHWTLTKEHETNPWAAVNALLDMCAQMALDPLISGGAAELVAKTKKAALLEAAEWFKGQGWDDAPRYLRRMAEGEQK